MKKLIILGCLAAVLGAAQASPITTPPPALVALGGDVKAVYIFADAADTSVLGISTASPIPTIFCNHSEGSCTGGTSGVEYLARALQHKAFPDLWDVRTRL